MAAISANGGARRYWRHEPTGTRLVLCGNGQFLVNRGGGRWRLPREAYSLAQLEADASWQPDTRPVVSAAVTRTGRQARRRGEG